MNLPNKLTLMRIILTPIFMAVLYWGFPGADYAALAIFIIASLTDLLDGKIARKYNLVTDFGKFADPLADKILVTAAMLWFVEVGRMPAWALLVVLLREIFKANAATIRLILAPDLEPEPVLVRFRVNLRSQTALVVLANSITLTPGTITAGLRGSELLVHCLDRSFSEGMEDSDFVKLLHRMEERAL